MATSPRSTSSKKRGSLERERTPSVAFSTLRFAHQTIGGNRTIDLSDLNPPGNVASDDPSKLIAATINENRSSLRIFNGFGNKILEGDQESGYEVRTNTIIELNFDPAEGEIISGEITPVANTGLRVVGTKRIIRTGTLRAGKRDINVGEFFDVGANIDESEGDVALLINGIDQFRNDGNADSATILANPDTLDGNFQEVDAGAGFGTLLKINTDEVSLVDRAWKVRGTGLLIDNPSFSTFDQFERVFGIIQRMSDQLEDTSGQPKVNWLAGAPSNALLKAFGDLVIQNKDNIAGLLLPVVDSVVFDGADGLGATNTRIRNLANIRVNIGDAITGALSGTLGASITINENGLYWVSYTDQRSTTFSMGITVNSALLSTSINSVMATNPETVIAKGAGASVVTQFGTIRFFSTGDIIRPHTEFSTMGTDAGTRFECTKVRLG